MTFTAPARTAQTRPNWPEARPGMPPETAHPRALEVAQAMRDGANTFASLMRAGFTTGEITELHDEARNLATVLSTRQVEHSGDLLKQMVEKALEPNRDNPPMPRNTRETQSLVMAWYRYCAANEAYMLDPWWNQYERCIALLRAYFALTAARGTATADHVINEVSLKLRARD